MSIDSRVQKYLEAHAGEKIHPLTIAKKFKCFALGVSITMQECGWHRVPGGKGYYST